MKNIKPILILLLMPLLSACLTDVYQQDQEVLIESDDETKKVKLPVYYFNRPKCDYEVVGYIEVDGFYYTKELVFQYMADEAHSLKADAVDIDYLQQLDTKEYIGLGKAIRCLNKTIN